MRLSDRARSFLASSSGAIIPLLGLSMFIIAGMVGLAIDAARGYGAKSHLQNAVDAAALAAARRVAEDPSADATEVFNTFFNAARPEGHHIAIGTINVTRSGNTVTAEVDASMPTLFMAIFGQQTMSVGTLSAAQFGFGEIELALALDTTGSMDGSKLASLKTAATGLIDTLHRATPTTESLRIGVVPFSNYVNVGTANRYASWIDVPPDTHAPNCYDTYPNVTYSNCQARTGTCSNDGVPYTCTWNECDTDWGQPVNVCNPYTKTWQGCVSSRSYPLNVQDANYATRIPGLLDVGCANPITPLTTDRTAARDAINALAASGNTYIPEGLMWGWRVLSSQEPMTGSLSGGAGAATVSRYLVLMTDGANTLSPSGNTHDGGDVALANQYTAEACSNVKADGITVFTVAFEVTDNAIKDVLRTCASNDGFFFDAIDAARLQASFDAIGRLLVNLRVKY